MSGTVNEQPVQEALQSLYAPIADDLVEVESILKSELRNEHPFVDEMVRYVQTMPDGMDTTSPAHTQYMQLCVACHGPTGEGLQALGAPSLLDDVWLYGSSPAEIRKTILEGRAGAMPAHGDLIGADRARILTAYIYSLSQ